MRLNAVTFIGSAGAARMDQISNEGFRATASVPRAMPIDIAAHAASDHDLDGFRVRFDSADGVSDGLQPGMTVWLPGGT
jgi:hypothetical protein